MSISLNRSLIALAILALNITSAGATQVSLIGPEENHMEQVMLGSGFEFENVKDQCMDMNGELKIENSWNGSRYAMSTSGRFVRIKIESGHSQQVSPPGTPTLKALYATISRERFREYCGTGYVASLIRAVQLIATIDVEFGSDEEVAKFMAQSKEGGILPGFAHMFIDRPGKALRYEVTDLRVLGDANALRDISYPIAGRIEELTKVEKALEEIASRLHLAAKSEQNYVPISAEVIPY